MYLENTFDDGKYQQIKKEALNELEKVIRKARKDFTEDQVKSYIIAQNKHIDELKNESWKTKLSNLALINDIKKQYLSNHPDINKDKLDGLDKEFYMLIQKIIKQMQISNNKEISEYEEKGLEILMDKEITKLLHEQEKNNIEKEYKELTS